MRHLYVEIAWWHLLSNETEMCQQPRGKGCQQDKEGPFFFFFLNFFNAILVCLYSFYVCMYVCMYGFVGSSFLCEGFL